jgi:hypothetical protein
VNPNRKQEMIDEGANNAPLTVRMAQD